MNIEHGGDLFAVARERGWDWREVLDLSASINPLGPSPHVREAICGAVDKVAHYPEKEPSRLIEALAAYWGIDPDRVLLGNGATELIHFLAQELPTDITIAVPTFSEFHRVWPCAGIADWDRPETWPAESVLVVTNPNNPCGDYKQIRRSGPMLLDESFIEFAGEESAVTKTDPDLVVLRSLTKFYALPGLRIGAVVASPERVRAWRQRRPPWQVNVLAEAAALAALADTEHARRTLSTVAAEREWLFEQLSRFPILQPRLSRVNYIWVQIRTAATALGSALLSRKILVRRIDEHSIRIAVRTRHENQRLISALEEVLCA